jgi:hypothetical protein
MAMRSTPESEAAFREVVRLAVLYPCLCCGDPTHSHEDCEHPLTKAYERSALCDAQPHTEHDSGPPKWAGR